MRRLVNSAAAAGTAEALHLALALAAKAAQQVSRAVLETVLREPGPWLHSRWVVTLDYAPGKMPVAGEASHRLPVAFGGAHRQLELLTKPLMLRCADLPYSMYCLRRRALPQPQN